MARLDTGAADFDAALARLAYWDASGNEGNEGNEAVERAVSEILRAVRERGDAAVLEYTRRFDGLDADSPGALRLDAARLAEAHAGLPAADREALEDAAARIRDFHERQLGDAASFDYEDGLGNRLGQRVVPLDRVGVYVPGGQAAYPSTALMTLVPARVAGVGQRIVVVPAPGGQHSEHVLAALHVGGADLVFTIGGAQAIAALAYGTATIPRVDKIVGPGGAYVAEAKRQVFGPVGIDSIAGPSEVVIVADGSVPVRWTALDLFSQAEHDAAAQAILLSPDAEHLDAVTRQMEALLPEMSRRSVIAASLDARGALIRTRDLDEAVEIANRLAPEHLQLAVADPDALLPRVRHAGAIFLGGHAAEALGDYSAGPSHVLPTFGTARYASPLGVNDFRKRSSVIGVSAAGAAPLARTAAAIAGTEGLEAHALSALARLEDT